MAISQGNVTDLIASFLHQIKVVHDNEHIQKITLGPLVDGKYSMKVEFKEEVTTTQIG